MKDMRPPATHGSADGPRVAQRDDTAEQRRRFARSGVLLLERWLDDDAIDLLRTATEKDVESADHPRDFTSEFERFSNRFLARSTRLKPLVSALRAPISALVGYDVVFTQGMLLELHQGDPGFLWHFDEYSFCFVRPEDRAFTVWMPLHDIHTDGQHGGMEWVEQQHLCARSRMKQGAWFQAHRAAVHQPGDPVEAARADQFGYRWAGAYDHLMFDALKTSCDMRVGDIFLFDRFTWHRSHPLRPGPCDRRTAVVLRVVAADARFDKLLFEDAMAAREAVSVPPLFGHRLAHLPHGITMREAVASGISVWTPVP